MNDSIDHIFANLFRVEASKILERVRQECADEMANAAHQGSVHSSRAALQLEAVIKGAEASLIDVAFRLAMRSYSAAGIEITPKTASDVVQKIQDAVKNEETSIRDAAYSKPPFRGERPMINIDESKDRLNSSRYLEFTRIKGEIDLISLRNSRKPPEPQSGEGGMVFNGPVEQVITGTGNTGTIHKTIDTSSAQELREALNEVVKVLKFGTVDETDRALIDIAEEAKQEIEEAKPNRFKLGGLISGLNQGLSTIPKARQAFDVLKGIVDSIDIF